MKDILKKPFVRRALRTFIQAAVGYVVTNMVTADLTQKNAVVSLIGAALAAGIAAVMNLNEKSESEENENE